MERHPRRADQQTPALQTPRAPTERNSPERRRSSSPSVPRRFLPRRHAPGQHLRASRRAHTRSTSASWARSTRWTRTTRDQPSLPLQARLLASRCSHRGRLGAGTRTSSSRRSAPCANRSSTSPEGHLLLARPLLPPVPRPRPLPRWRCSRLARAAAEDPAQHRGSGPPARPRARSVEDHKPLPRALDGRAHGRARWRCAEGQGKRRRPGQHPAAAAYVCQALTESARHQSAQQQHIEELAAEQRTRAACCSSSGAHRHGPARPGLTACSADARRGIQRRRCAHAIKRELIQALGAHPPRGGVLLIFPSFSSPRADAC